MVYSSETDFVKWYFMYDPGGLSMRLSEPFAVSIIIGSIGSRMAMRRYLKY
ncbi:MAG: hypothetical protein ACLR0I_01665 [Streptococcus salivarius]